MSTRYGDGTDFECIPESAQTVDETTPIAVKVVDMRDMDKISFQLITEDVTETVPVDTGDDAVAADDELNFAGFDFTGLEDATIRISGSEDNDGDFTIVTGSDGSAEVTPTPTNETFDPETVTVLLIHTEDPVTGAWTFEASNNYAPGGIAPYGQVETSGDWTDVTTLFDVDAVTAASSQFVQAEIRCRAIRGTFTPTDGNGTVRANTNAKGWS